MRKRDPQKNKEYCKAHYEKNKAEYKRRSKQQRANLRATVQELKGTTCSECGGTFHTCQLDFDHLGDKEFDIGKAVSVGCSEKKLREEIAKCQVVCANCHRLLTYNRSFGVIGSTLSCNLTSQGSSP